MLDPADREWSFDDCSVGDARDPEGNVFQLRQAQGCETLIDAGYGTGQ